jgi:hypothetical protein
MKTYELILVKVFINPIMNTDNIGIFNVYNELKSYERICKIFEWILVVISYDM